MEPAGRAAERPLERWTRLGVLAGALVLVLAVAVLYAQTARHAFLRFDDTEYVTQNPNVLGGPTAANLRWAWIGFHASNWHPLTWMSHQLDVRLFGLAPGPHHLESAALHALGAVLVLLFLRGAGGRTGPAFLVALLFAVHPLRAESVAWVSERKDVLAGVFFGLTLLAYAWHARVPSPRRLALVALCLALGLLAKPTLVSAPLVLLLLDRWPLRRTGSDLGARLREKLPLLALAGLSALATVAAQRAGGALQSLETLSLSERVATALRAPFTYLAQSLWPTRLAFFYPHPTLIPGRDFAPLGLATGLAALGTLGLSLLAWRLRERVPELLVGWGWLLAMLLPVSGLVQVGNQLHADRYTYLPLLGPLFALVLGLDARIRPPLRRIGFALGLTAAFALAIVAKRQIATWKDTETLCAQALAVTADNYVAYEHLGLELQERGDLAGARAAYEAALAIRPDLTGSLGNLGALLVQLGQPEAARECFERLLEAHPDEVPARLGLAHLALQDGAYAEVERLLAPVRPEQPGYALAQLDLASASEWQGRWKEALACYERAFAAAPPDPAAALSAAWILATGPDESVTDGARAVELARIGAEAGLEHALVVLAAAHARRGDFEDAVRFLQEVQRGTTRPAQRYELEQQMSLYRTRRPYTRAR